MFEKHPSISVETTTQIATINDGTFNYNNLQYIVYHDEYIDFTNNAEIPAEKINA